MLKLVMMPPQNDLQRQWAPRLQRSLPDYRVVVPETDAEARHERIDADAAYGWVPPDALPAATRLRWLQNPQAGPSPGYSYPALIAHPVVVCNPRGIYFDHISHLADLDTLQPRADFVIVTTPHTPETEGMWHAQRFHRMKRTAHFVSVGRGRTTCLDDLADALEHGIIAGCGLDVFEVEPLPAEHRLWTMPNVLLTPHIAVRDAENIPERRFQVLFDNAHRFAAGEPLRNVVDKAAWY
jgi:phosphoglycerate dehydrogenase-like enzyme